MTIPNLRKELNSLSCFETLYLLLLTGNLIVAIIKLKRK